MRVCGVRVHTTIACVSVCAPMCACVFMRVLVCLERVQGFKVRVKPQGVETLGGLQNVDYAERGVIQTESGTAAEPSDPSAVITRTRIHSLISSGHSETPLNP